jgi:predicted DNA-binding protein (UPF0251 family)
MPAKKAGRPSKTRYIKACPTISQFSPRGKAGRPNEIELAIDQYESIRLADYKAMPHAACGKIMGISRQTFERILRNARNKIADAIVNGKIIRIERGKVKIG